MTTIRTNKCILRVWYRLPYDSTDRPYRICRMPHTGNTPDHAEIRKLIGYANAEIYRVDRLYA